ncbi:hypothetical protein [Psychrobacillus sp. FSL H8-0510]|uniref:hypothetical protein n=1 Tax=Psychrobacillus sp. FSL H8-0510 TaxID=2921394 RepID=UPI0030FAFA48
MNKEKTKKKIINNQKKYKKLREKASNELIVLMDYFGKGRLDDLTTYTEIKKHLEAHQKEIAYFGLRGIFIGLVTAVFAFMFNTQVIPKLGTLEFGNRLISYIFNQIVVVIIFIIFFLIYYLTAGEFFNADNNRRNQIYINEYMIKLVDEKIKTINNKKECK